MNNALQKGFFANIGRLFKRPQSSFSTDSINGFIVLEGLSQFDAIQIATSDAILIKNATLDETKKILHSIRSAKQREVYLKPVFLQSRGIYEQLGEQVDGLCATKGQLESIKNKALKINAWSQRLKVDATNRDIKSNILVKTVQYLYTREALVLKPYPSKESPIDYSFPFINSFFSETDNLDLIKLLETGVIEEWLTKATEATTVVDGKTIEINDYTLTLAGEDLARSGYYEINKENQALPEGILPILPFKNKVAEALKTANQQSYLIKFNLINHNLSFLSTKAQEELARDCVKYLQKINTKEASISFTPDSNLWLLLPNSNDELAIDKAEFLFGKLKQMLRGILDINQPLLELNMYKVADCIPKII